MKIQNLFILLALLTLALVAGCSDDKEDTPTPGEGNLQLELTATPEIISFVSTSADSCKLYLKTNTSWQIKTTADWCSCNKYRGEGSDSVTVYVGDNDQLNKRNGDIIITGGKEPVTVPVVQFGRNVEFLAFVGTDVLENKQVELDFETFVYKFSFVSNVKFSATMDRVSKASGWIQEKPAGEDVGTSTYPGFAYGRWIDVRLADNEGPERRSFYELKHDGGDKRDTIYIIQKAYESFLRFNLDTISIGSHFKKLHIAGWGDVDWNFEFLDENDRVTSAPDWLENVKKRVDGTSPSRLGTTQALIGDVKYNLTEQPRTQRIRFFYDVNGKPMENIVTVLQLANNAWKSDSLVLMRIAEQNSSESGMSVENWELGVPMENWTNIGWIYDNNGVKRINRILLGGCMMVNEISPDLCNLDELVELQLARNYLSGPVPEELGLLSKLEVFDITDNFNNNPNDGPNAGITKIPTAFFEGCTHLKTLKVSKNLLSEVPAGLGKLTELEVLDLSANPITSFPSDMDGLKKLKTLSLSAVKYSGAFVDFIFDMPELQYVTLNGMDFKGNALPDRFGSLPQLRNFSASFSNIGGELPPSLGQCKRLNFFEVSAGENATVFLTGTLPAEYGQLDSLQVFGVSDNKITGNIPESYANLMDFWYRTNSKFLGLWLNGNCMSGKIPDIFLQHYSWNGGYHDVENPLTGKTEFVEIGNMNPKRQICPQRAGFGFENCGK